MVSVPPGYSEDMIEWLIISGGGGFGGGRFLTGFGFCRDLEFTFAQLVETRLKAHSAKFLLGDSRVAGVPCDF
jgi:hypothetical protein